MKLNILLAAAALALVTFLAGVSAGLPAPVAWSLLLTGFLAAGATVRARRRQPVRVKA